VYFHSQNLQYMQNLQRECTHSFFKKAAFRVGLHPLKNQKSLKMSGFVPTRNNKKSLIEWARPRHPHPDTHAHAHRWESPPRPFPFATVYPPTPPLTSNWGPPDPSHSATPLPLPLTGGGLPPSAAARYPPPDSNRLRPAIAEPRPGGRQLLCGDARISLIFFA